MSVDPLEIIDDPNPYCYVRCSPVVGIDPTGLTFVQTKPEISDAEKLGLKDCHCYAAKVTKIGPYTGLVYCKDGKFTKLVNPDVPKDFPDDARCRYYPSCTLFHEDHHILQYQHRCPEACKDKPCNLDKKPPDFFIYRMAWYSEECQHKAECYAYIDSVICVIGLMNFHKSGRPGASLRCVEVGKTLLKRVLEVRSEYKCGDVAIPADIQEAIDEILK
jgi:hypothetical protein